MSTTHRYSPRDGFVDALEQDVIDRYRSVAPMKRRLSPRSARIAALVLISLSLGATAGFASAQIGKAAARDSVLSAARAEAELARVRRELARAQAADVARKVQAGALDQDALAKATAEVREVEARYARLALDIDEITATGQAPRDDLNSPLVNGRDFVKQRIQAEAMGVQARYNAAEEILATVDRRVRVGAGSAAAASAAKAGVARARADLAIVAEKLKLRDEFLSKATPIDELVKRLDETRVMQEVMVILQQLNASRERLDLVELLRKSGAADEVQLLRAQLDVKENEAALQRLNQRLKRSPEDR